jgi:hypothetical protein
VLNEADVRKDENGSGSQGKEPEGTWAVPGQLPAGSDADKHVGQAPDHKGYDQPTNGGLTPGAWRKTKRALLNPTFWMTAATVVIAATTIFYTYYARKQWVSMDAQLAEIRRQYPELQRTANAAKESADLTRQQVVGAQAAVLHIRFQVVFQLMPLDSFGHGLRAILDTAGGSPLASDIHESFDVSWKTVPGLRTIGRPQHFEFVIPQYRAVSISGVPVAGLTSEVWEPISHGEGSRTIEIRGAFRYNNGFSEVPDQPFCLIWYAHLPIHNYSFHDFIDCSEYANEASFFDSMERKAAGEKAHQQTR